VSLTIPIARADAAVAVPISAVFRGDGNKKVVYVRGSSGPEKREVRVGVTNFDYAEIKDGVQEGEIVMLVEPDHPGTEPSVPIHPSNGKPAAKAGSKKQRSS
jgi:multidrug efflux pump subunit AcrA (membrane-fusion protein)